MEIKIGKSARHCTGCSREFVHEEPLHSIARLEQGLLNREDFCDACWGSAGIGQAFSVWHSKFCDPRVAEQQPAEVFSPLRQLFYESVDATDRREMAKAYLAAHLLRRQKVFRLIKESDGTDDDELSIALFSDRIGNRLIEVRDPSLSHEELETGRFLLLARLKELEEGAGDANTAESVEEAPADDCIDAESQRESEDGDADEVAVGVRAADADSAESNDDTAE